VTRILLLLSLGWVAIAQPSASPSGSDWRFAHPDADMKMSISVQALLKSDAIAKAIEQGKAQAKDNALQIQMAEAMLRSVDRISVSARQKAPNDMDVLAVITGSFDPQLIAGMFPSTGKGQVKVVGEHTILIGEGDSFTQAVARMAGPAALGSGDELDRSDIWIQVSAAMLAQQSGQQGAPLLKDLRGISLGVTLSETPVVDVVLTASDAAGAATLLGTFQAMTPLLAASPAGATAAKALNLTQDGSRLRMHLKVPPELVAMLQQQASASATSSSNGGGFPAQLAPLLGSFGIGGAAAPSPKLAAGPAAPPPPAKNDGKIKIYGLDDGPKELPGPK
jgi:hypothetical protein